MALFAAAALAAGAAPGPARAGDADCVPVERGCLPWSQVDEYTELYLAPGAGGEVRGFQDFANFAGHVQATMGASISLAGGTVRIDTSGIPSRVPVDPPVNPHHTDPQYPEYPGYEEQPPSYGGEDGGDEYEGWPDGGGGGWSAGTRADADYAMFYERPNWQGSAFMVMPKSSEDLNQLRHPFGGVWKGRVRAVAIMGGQPAKPGVQLCADVACKAKKPIILWNNSQFLIPPVIVPMISRVSVFP